MAPNPMRFEIHPAANNGKRGYRVHFEDTVNHTTIFWTQVYNDPRNADHAIALARAYAATAPIDRSRIKRAA